jgi:hypothetical protein
MIRLVRLALGMSAALAFGSAAQAQVRAVPYTPLPVHPLPLPMPIPMPSVTLTGPSLTISPAPNLVVTIPSNAAVPAPVVQVVPPQPPGQEPPPDGEEHCEDRDGNALNDPDDCQNDGSAPADNAADAIDVNGSGVNSLQESFNSMQDAAAEPAAEPAAAGWRPSWWMIALGVVAALFLLGWISGRRR